MDRDDYKKVEKTKNFLNQIKIENKNFDSQIQIISLNNQISHLKKENQKINKAKFLIQKYMVVLDDKCKKISKLKIENYELTNELNNIPQIIRMFFKKLKNKGGDYKKQ